jgi:maleate isomerase
MNKPDVSRLGVVVPSGNAAVEPELATLLGPTVNVYATRFPVYAEFEQRVRIARYNDALPAAIESFGGLRPAAVIAECSGSHYLQGPDEESRFCAELSARYGTEVTTVTRTVLSALEVLGAGEVTLVSPYAPWLTELSRGYWEAAGLTVRDIVKVRSANGFSPYDVTTAELVEQVGAARRGPAEVLLVTGTGMPTLAALHELGAGRDRVILTSNLCAAWWAMRTLAPEAGPESYLGWPLRVSAGAPA